MQAGRRCWMAGWMPTEPAVFCRELLSSSNFHQIKTTSSPPRRVSAGPKRASASPAARPSASTSASHARRYQRGANHPALSTPAAHAHAPLQNGDRRLRVSCQSSAAPGSWAESIISLNRNLMSSEACLTATRRPDYIFPPTTTSLARVHGPLVKEGMMATLYS